MRMHIRHQAVLIYSNELGRITRGRGGGAEGRRWRVCGGGGTFFCWGSSLPSLLAFSHLQTSYLHGWGEQGEGAGGGRWRKKRKKMERLETGNREADSMPADKHIQCQGDTIISKMAAASGVLCGTNPETRRSPRRSGWHFFGLSTLFFKHNEANEIWTAHWRINIYHLNLNTLKTKSGENGCGLWRDIDQQYLVTPSGHS